MTFAECLEFVQRNSTGFLATVEEQKPHVRPMTVWLADDTGVYFYTSLVKPLAAQLRANPQVEIAFHQPGPPPEIGVVLRIAGRIEFVQDMKIRERLYATYDWLKQIGTGTPDCPTIVVFRIAGGRFNYWTWENNINPGPWVPFP
ncbi:MAG: pyridoxamine 5'-phosphate oxidase family protein [Proteobacteria bacterium]|nr:pyridoxamine 5'-phosphate oxidase family protein [Pseudomonadota bacterium]MBU4384892.1 pyridoxamine 5'-phosphate oxidase family protein [Pseudomonadota bacterium]MCG2763818.1 pyridoxamine 5'-phosphate oxidase family protein [Desulfarculaceae bacterium]